MTFNEYQKEALRTANPECRDIVNVALGLCGEASEFSCLLLFDDCNDDDSVLAKELGDLCWYVSVGSFVLNRDLSEIAGTIERKDYPSPNDYQKTVMKYFDKDKYFTCARVMELCGEFADVVKKHTFQGHELNVHKLYEILCLILHGIAALFDFIGYTFEEGLQMNVDKLRKRYPNGFETEKSINREE